MLSNRSGSSGNGSDGSAERAGPWGLPSAWMTRRRLLPSPVVLLSCGEAVGSVACLLACSPELISSQYRCRCVCVPPPPHSARARAQSEPRPHAAAHAPSHSLTLITPLPLLQGKRPGPDPLRLSTEKESVLLSLNRAQCQAARGIPSPHHHLYHHPLRADRLK